MNCIWHDMKHFSPSSIKEIDLSKLYILYHRGLQKNTLDTILKKKIWKLFSRNATQIIYLYGSVLTLEVVLVVHD